MNVARRTPYPDWVAYDPDLVPPRELMRREGIAEGWRRVQRAYEAMPTIKPQVPQQHPYMGKRE